MIKFSKARDGQMITTVRTRHYITPGDIARFLYNLELPLEEIEKLSRKEIEIEIRLGLHRKGDECTWLNDSEPWSGAATLDECKAHVLSVFKIK